jgi:exonuclease SbcD
MKFLHLSDLHIGKSVNGRSMLDEQRNVFRRIIEYVQTERPRAVVVAGDVYDRAVPVVDAVRVFDDFITDLAAKDVEIMLISGNHDSPERLNYASRLLSESRVYMCGAFDGKPRRVTLADEYGDVNFWLLPFIKPITARGVYGSREIETYGDAVSAALETADVDYTARNVLVAHQFFTRAGVEPARSESELDPIGGLDAVNAEIIDKFDYAALGHLHRAQTVGADRVRYSGSPLKYSFSEWRNEKSVTLAQLGRKGSLTVSELPLKPLHDMLELRGKLDVLIGDETRSGIDRESYLRVVLTDEDEIVDPMGKIRSAYPNVMALDFENSRTFADMSAVAAADLGNTESLSPYELFSQFFLEVTGSAMGAEQAAAARELLETGGGEV